MKAHNDYIAEIRATLINYQEAEGFPGLFYLVQP